MGQFVETIDGISQACSYLDFPVVSGNVSFYNETKKNSIYPTPTIGGVGLIKNLNYTMNKNLKEIDSNILIIGKTSGHLFQSEFFREVLNFKEGSPPAVNLFNEKNNGLSILNLISKNLVNSVHDISSGGILVALVEMCISGKIGAKVKIPKRDINHFEFLFGEDQSRYIIEVNEKNMKEVDELLKENSVYYEKIGKTQKDSLDIDNICKMKLNSLGEISNKWFKSYYKE